MDRAEVMPMVNQLEINPRYHQTATAAFCRENGIEGVTMWSWLWRPSYAAIAENSGVRCYVHTVNDRETAEALLQSGVSAVYTDYLVLHED